MAEEEEKKEDAEVRDASSEVEAEEDREGLEVSDEDDNMSFPFPRRPWDGSNKKEARCIAVATQRAHSREAINMDDPRQPHTWSP